MDASNNQRVASALFRAGLLDEATLRGALDAARGQDLAALVVQRGLVRPEDLQRALAPPSGRLGASSPALDLTVQTGPPAGARPSGRLGASSPALDLTVQTGPPAGARPSGRLGASSPALDLTVQTGPPGRGPASEPPGVGSTLGGALAVAPGEPVPAGARLGPYRLERLIAKGGMGAVFVAEHAALGRRVALKVLLAGEGASAEQLERFLVEARTSSKVKHPNVVPIYEVGEQAGVHYMTMELVDGPSLRQVVRDEGPLPPRRALHLLEQAARGVAAAHAEKVIHRDLKPHNVLVAPGDVAKVMDFGLAKETDQAGRGLTVSGALLGTPSYMAPEQAAGERVGPPADVYGLGAILYECLTGRPPFEGATLANIITKVVTQDVVAPRQHKPALHPDVETICLKALEKDPRRRYAGARALADDAARWLAGEAILARPLGRLERAARWARRRVPHLVAGGVAVAALLTLGGWLLVVAPGRERAAAARVLAEQAAAADASRRAEAEGFAAALDATRRALRALLAAATPEGDEVEAARARAREEAAALEAAWSALSPEARARVEEAPPFVDVPAVEAGLWAAVARAREAGGDAAGAAAARAAAYGVAPTTDVGRAAIAEVVLRDVRPAAAAVIDDLLRATAGLPPELERRLRAERGRRRVAAFDLPGAARDLRRAVDLGADDVRALLDLVEALRREATFELPPGARGEREVTGVRVHRRRRGAPATFEARFDDGSGGVYQLDPGAGRATPLAEVAAPAIDDPVAPGELGGRTSAYGGTRARPLGAHFTTASRLVLTDGQGRVLAEVARATHAARALFFADLDDDPATDHLVLVMGPNSGDSLLLRVDARGQVTPEELDVAGRRSPTMPGAASYVDHAEWVPTATGPRLVLAYGAWGANLLRVLREEAGRMVVCGRSEELGHARSLAWVEDAAGGPLLLVAHQEHEEPRRPEWTPRGLAAYRLEEDRVASPPAALHPLADDEAAALTLRTALVLRLDRTYAALDLAGRGPAAPHEAGGRFRLVALGEAAPLVDAARTAAWPPPRAAGDVLGAGREQLLVPAPGGRLRALGAPGPAPALPPEPAPDVDPRRATALAAGHLDALGFRSQALDVLLDREAAQGGPTLETEAAALDALERTDRARGREHAVAPDFATDAAFLADVERFVQAPGRTERAAALALLLAARHRLRDASDGDLARVAADLGRVGPGPDLPPAAADERRRLSAALALRSGEGLRVEVDFTRPEALGALVASDPLRVRHEPGRGLVARVSRRAPLVAGVPVEVPPGPVRVTVRLRAEGRTWQGRYEVGLLRAAAGPTTAGCPLEGLTVGGALWRAAGELRTATHEVLLGFGRRDPDAPDHGLLVPGAHQPMTFSLAHPLTARADLEAVLEHDPRARAGHVLLRERETGRVLVDRDGTSLHGLAPGQYLAGLVVHVTPNPDFLGQNFAPEAVVVLEHLRLEALPLGRAGPPRLLGAGEADPALLAERPGGMAVALDAGVGTAEAALRALAARARGRPPGERAGALLALADARARAGGAAADVLGDVEAAWSDGPFGLLQALEAAGGALDDRAATAVREVLRRALAATGDAGVAALEVRAIAHRLRGEPTEALGLLDRCDALAGGPSRERAWVRAALAPSEASIARFNALWGRALTPEHPQFMRVYWAPLDGGDGAAIAAAEVERRLAGGRTGWGELDAWLSRWVELDPGNPAAWRERARLSLQAGAAGVVGLWFRSAADLRRALALDPADGQAILDLASLELALLDQRGAGDRLRAAHAARRLDVRQVVAALGRQRSTDPGWPAFAAAVVGDDRAWAAYRRRLVEAGGDDP